MLPKVKTKTNIFQDDVVSKPFRIGDLIPKVEELALRYSTPSTPKASRPPSPKPPGAISITVTMTTPTPSPEPI